MASALQKLLRKSPFTRIITTIRNSQSSNQLERLAYHHYPVVKINRECQTTNVNPVSEEFNPSRFTTIYPSFPFGFALNPISSTGFVPAEANDAALDDSRKMWADSVKKKRKKKMNKHKYKKLRKRMRGHT